MSNQYPLVSEIYLNEYNCWWGMDTSWITFFDKPFDVKLDSFFRVCYILKTTFSHVIPHDCSIWEQGTHFIWEILPPSICRKLAFSSLSWPHHLHHHAHDDYDDQGVDPIIYRDPLRSPQFDSTYLNNPSFVGSFEDPHFVYFFFRSSSRWL